MPLLKSGSNAAKSRNISEMLAAGHPRDQAIAAAMSTARRYGKAAGGPVSRSGAGDDIGPITDSEVENQQSEFHKNIDRQFNKRQSYSETIPATENLNPKDMMTPDRMAVQSLPHDPRPIFDDSGRIVGFDNMWSPSRIKDVDPFERAARRTRQSVMPEEGRQGPLGSNYADGGRVDPDDLAMADAVISGTHANDFMLTAGSKSEEIARPISTALDISTPSEIAETIHAKNLNGEQLDNVFSYIPQRKRKAVIARLDEMYGFGPQPPQRMKTGGAVLDKALREAKRSATAWRARWPWIA